MCWEWARWIEKHFYVPLLLREGQGLATGWNEILAGDHAAPSPHISMRCAIGRRLRRTCAWILAIQALAYHGKIAVPPTPMVDFAEALRRADVGPIPGAVMLLGGVAFNAVWIIFALVALHADRVRHGQRTMHEAMG
ncbi:MAG: DUF2270 domain-containing protein [Phreatobacter sp.]